MGSDPGCYGFHDLSTMSQVLLIGGSTGPMLEALEVVGDGNDGPLGDVSITQGCI